MTDFPYAMEMPVRLGDIDMLHHVNSVSYARYLEQARAEFFEDVVGVTLDHRGRSIVIVDLELSYERSIAVDESVTVGLRVLELGDSSIPMEYEIVADGDRAATARTVVLPYEVETQETFPIPPEWREPLERYRST